MAGPGMEGRNARMRAAGIGAAACFVLALTGFGAALDGYAHAAWPVALLGAAGVPRAAAFNLLGFIVPGLLAAWVAWQRRAGLDARAGVGARLGWTLALLAALAFTAQGLLPLDPSAPDAGRGRLHAVAWSLWGLAFAAAALALAGSALRGGNMASALGHLGAGILVFAPAWLAADALPVALAQRLAFVAWFAWLVAAALAPRQRAH